MSMQSDPQQQQPQQQPQQPRQQSGTGLPANVAGALSYVLGALTGIVFYVLETDHFVRFHALQSIFLTVAWVAAWIVVTIVSGILAFIPILGWLIGLILWAVVALGGLGVWLYMIVKAYQGATTRLPYISDMADRYAMAM